MNESLPEAVSVWRHPRRWGFLIFNIICIALVAIWSVKALHLVEDIGVFGLPVLALESLGITFVVIAWVVAWIAWIIMVVRRHRRHHSV